MVTYNYRLYEKRKSLGLSRRKMARAIGLNPLRYKMMENGYIKPLKGDVAKISAFLEEDYSLYLQGPSSNPADLPEKEGKIADFFYRVMGKLWVKILLVAITVGLLGLTTSGFVIDARLTNEKQSYYEDSFIAFANEIREQGEPHFTLFDSFMVPEITESAIDEDTGEKKYIELIGHYEDKDFLDFECHGTYRDENMRLTITLIPLSGVQDAASITATVVYYEYEKGRESYSYRYDQEGNVLEYSAIEAPYYNFSLMKAKKFVQEINSLIDEKMECEITLLEALQMKSRGAMATADSTLYVFFTTVFGFIFAGIFLFATLFAFFYGKKKGFEGIRFVEDKPYELETRTDKKPLKKDIRFGPFIPETFFEIFGILLLFAAIISRFSGYIDGFFGDRSFGQYLASNEASNDMGMFILGMFLLYFIDFDIFLEDRRVVRNVFLYGIIFICLYHFEVVIMDSIDTGSIVGSLANMIQIPNMFGSISCYFMITFFLFYTPKWCDKTYKRIIHRCLAVLPIAWIIVSWIIYRGNGVFFNLEMSRSVLYIFNGERLPFSILAISYLVGLYFLRLFYELKYGKNNAQIYYNSNRFLWQKNIMTALIVMAVAIVEYALSNNTTAIKMDIGSYYQLWVLAPLLLFYHPHKGPRIKALDYVITISYGLALIIAYVSIALFALLGLASTML